MSGEKTESMGQMIDRVCYQLKSLVERVAAIAETLEDREELERQEAERTVFSVETTDQDELQRYLKATDALLALNEIANGVWQREMIKYGGADKIHDGEGNLIRPSEAMGRYRDHVFQVLEQYGIALDGLL